MKFCMTDDDGHYETKKSNIFFGGGSPPPENFCEFSVDFENFLYCFYRISLFKANLVYKRYTSKSHMTLCTTKLCSIRRSECWRNFTKFHVSLCVRMTPSLMRRGSRLAREKLSTHSTHAPKYVMIRFEGNQNVYIFQGFSALMGNKNHVDNFQ